MKLYRLFGRQTLGLQCDCCICIDDIEAYVIAPDKSSVREVARASRVSSITKVNVCVASVQGDIPGLLVVKRTNAYKGVFSKAPKE